MRPVSFLSATVVLLFATACSDAITIDPGDDDQTAIQTAFIDVTDGQVIELGAGTFTLTDALEMSNRTDVTLRGAGMDETVLDFSGQQTGGAGVDMLNMTNVVIEDLAIVDAAGNGLRISNSDGVVIRRVRAGWTAEDDVTNGKYAIYPVSSSDVLIEDSLAENASDAGLYVGQVSTCVVRDNVARGNVAGIEIENSTNCDVYGNTAESNTGGLLVFELPGLPMDGAGTLVRDNVIRGNNRPNFGDPTTVVGLVPTGTGLFILAANDIEIRDNVIEDNNGAALAVVSYPIISALTGDPPPDDESYDPYSEGIWVHGNTFSGNGTSPGGQTASGLNDTLQTLLGLMAAQGVELTEVEEIAWDGFTRDDLGPSDVLCFRDNEGAEFRYLDIPGLLGDDLNTNTDGAPHDCMGPTQNEVDATFASFAE